MQIQALLHRIMHNISASHTIAPIILHLVIIVNLLWSAESNIPIRHLHSIGHHCTPHHATAMGIVLNSIKRNNGFSEARLYANCKDINLSNNMRRNLDNMIKSLPYFAPSKNTVSTDTLKIMSSIQCNNPRITAAIAGTIKKLDELKERNWSIKDIPSCKYKTRYRPFYQNRVATAIGNYRVHDSCNEQRRIYTSQGSKFTEAQNFPKPYGVSSETIAGSWKDRGAVQITTNHESTEFNLINHSPNKSLNLASTIMANPTVCRKSKGITEYHDLTRVTASKLNKFYQVVAAASPTAFAKQSGHCAKNCDNGKTFGPSFNFFKR